MMDSDMLRYSSKPEWLPLLHNLCYLHAALKVRARYGRGGFNTHRNFLQIGNTELFVS